MNVKIKGAIALTVVLAACYAAVRYREKRTAPSAAGPASDLDAAAEGIKKHAEDFDGLYESLYQAGCSRQRYFTDAYEEWCDRAERSGDERFRRAFGALFSKEDTADETLCRERFGLLLSAVDRAGIVRERESRRAYRADEAMCRAYVSTDGQPIRPGETYTVIRSAWVSGGKVIEYGMAAPGEMST